MDRKIEVPLADDVIASLDERVTSGEFPSVQDVVRAAVDDWLEDEALRREELSDIRRQIRESIDDPRPSVPADDVRRKFDEKLKRRLAPEQDVATTPGGE